MTLPGIFLVGALRMMAAVARSLSFLPSARMCAQTMGIETRGGIDDEDDDLRCARDGVFAGGRRDETKDRVNLYGALPPV